MSDSYTSPFPLGSRNVSSVDLDALDAAVLAAAEAWVDETTWVGSAGPLRDAVLARKAARTPPQPVRKTWTVTTERRDAVFGEQFVTSDGKVNRVTWSNNDPYRSEADVIVGIEEQP
jgi:hypothetical protein